MYAIMGSIRRTAYIQDRMPELSEKIMVYFKSQDDEFYLYLNKKFADNEQALKMLEFLSCDLRYVRAKYLKFIERYADTMSEIAWRNFPREFNEFSRELMGRFQIEREYLIPLLEQLAQKMS